MGGGIKVERSLILIINQGLSYILNSRSFKIKNKPCPTKKVRAMPTKFLENLIGLMLNKNMKEFFHYHLGFRSCESKFRLFSLKILI